MRPDKKNGQADVCSLSLFLEEIRHNPLLWLLVLVPGVFAAEKLRPGSHSLLFVLSILAIVLPGGAAESCHGIRGGQDR